MPRHLAYLYLLVLGTFIGQGDGLSWNQYWDTEDHDGGHAHPRDIVHRVEPVDDTTSTTSSYSTSSSYSSSSSTSYYSSSSSSVSSSTSGIRRECLLWWDDDGSWYRGVVNVTKSGLPCQKWTDQFPNAHHKDTKMNRHYSGIGDHNYCRNPDYDEKPWCYNGQGTEPRWEYCEIPSCEMYVTYFTQTTPPDSKVSSDQQWWYNYYGGQDGHDHDHGTWSWETITPWHFWEWDLTSLYYRGDEMTDAPPTTTESDEEDDGYEDSQWYDYDENHDIHFDDEDYTDEEHDDDYEYDEDHNEDEEEDREEEDNDDSRDHDGTGWGRSWGSAGSQHGRGNRWHGHHDDHAHWHEDDSHWHEDHGSTLMDPSSLLNIDDDLASSLAELLDTMCTMLEAFGESCDIPDMLTVDVDHPGKTSVVDHGPRYHPAVQHLPALRFPYGHGQRSHGGPQPGTVYDMYGAELSGTARRNDGNSRPEKENYIADTPFPGFQVDHFQPFGSTFGWNDPGQIDILGDSPLARHYGKRDTGEEGEEEETAYERRKRDVMNESRKRTEALRSWMRMMSPEERLQMKDKVEELMKAKAAKKME